MGKDINGIIKTTVPLSSIIVQRPDDGLPCVADWLTCCISFMFSGSRLHREPLDLNSKSDACDPTLGPFLQIKKGFTRLMLGTIQSQTHFVVYPKFCPWVLLGKTSLMLLCLDVCVPRTAGLMILLIASDLDPIAGKDISAVHP